MTQPVDVEELPATEPVPGLAEWLALQHQDQQQQIADKTAAGLALLWAILQFDRLDDTTPAWLTASTLQVEQGFRESEQAAFEYVQGAKWVAEPFSAPLRKIETVFPTADLQLAMRATGPASIKRATARAVAAPVRQSEPLLPGVSPQVLPRDLDFLASNLMAVGKLNSTGAGVKFALNGGRGEIQQLVIEDAKSRPERELIGWARFTEDSANGPCYFCAILASQGAVYLDSTSFDRSNSQIRDFKTSVSAEDDPVVADLLGKLDAAVDKRGWATTRRAFVGGGPAKVHDHCKCTLRPVYRQRDDMDARAKFFLRQWKNLDKEYAKLPEDKKNPDDTDVQRFRKVYRRPPAYSVRPSVTLPQIQRQRNVVAEVLGENSPHTVWWDRQIAELQSLN